MAVLLALLFMFVIDPMLAHSARLDRQLQTVQRELQELQTLQREYGRQKRVLVGSMPSSNASRIFPFSRLEELAGQTGIRPVKFNT